MIAVIDYGAGNLQSVKNSLDRLGFPSIITSEREQILKADKLIFPGQGHFGACVQTLKERDLFDLLKEQACAKPFLGICLGMQLLFEKSEEAPTVQGLGILKGEVKRLGPRQKLPLMGWNLVQSKRTLFDGRWFYFAHSYYCLPENEAYIAACSFYGMPYVCAVQRGQLLAVQFHPEKSGPAGMQLLKAFAKGDLC
jgi:imidazole glycerol phosphate synthase glutamine amidotransferase subunit